MLRSRTPTGEQRLVSVRDVTRLDAKRSRTVGRLRDRVGVQQVTLTPACGPAGATHDHARAVLTRLLEAAQEVEQA